MFANGVLQHFALNSLRFFFEGDFAGATNFRIYGRPLRPLLFASLLGSLMSPTNQYREDTRDGAYGFSSSSEKTRMSNRLQMS